VKTSLVETASGGMGSGEGQKTRERGIQKEKFRVRKTPKKVGKYGGARRDSTRGAQGGVPFKNIIGVLPEQ